MAKSKRHLSNRQQARVNRRAYADDDTIDPSWKKGVVVAHHGKRVEIKPGSLFDQASGSPEKQLLSGHIRANLPTLVCGDRVLYQAADLQADDGADCVVEKIIERQSVLNRPRPYSDPKPVAANIDLIVLVIAPHPEPISNLIDRYLIAAEHTGIDIAIVINKTDLIAAKESDATKQELETLANLYQSLGYNVFSLSSKSLDINVSGFSNTGNYDQFYEMLAGKTSILVGQSGVGKSSLVNAVADKSIALTGNISEVTVKGKHTTTHSSLFQLRINWQNIEGEKCAAHCAIIDSPGIREFGLWHLEDEDIIDGLREFKPLANLCKFRDCDHKRSAGCALQAAFENGDIHPSRISSYQHILAAKDND